MYIFTIGPPTLLQQTRQIMEVYKSLTEHKCGLWKLGTRPLSFSFILGIFVLIFRYGFFAVQETLGFN
jgi:hypothetical protein